jgi:hypothetical protein
MCPSCKSFRDTEEADAHPSLRSVESHVIPAKAGIQFLPDMDPRFRGGDVLTFISMGGPQAHDHSG